MHHATQQGRAGLVADDKCLAGWGAATAVGAGGGGAPAGHGSTAAAFTTWVVEGICLALTPGSPCRPPRTSFSALPAALSALASLGCGLARAPAAATDAARWPPSSYGRTARPPRPARATSGQRVQGAVGLVVQARAATGQHRHQRQQQRYMESSRARQGGARPCASLVPCSSPARPSHSCGLTRPPPLA